MAKRSLQSHNANEPCRQVALATPSELQRGHYETDLSGTAWDAMIMFWDWDKERSSWSLRAAKNTLDDLQDQVSWDVDTYHHGQIMTLVIHS